MNFLAVAAGFDSIHHDVLGRHERKLRHEMLLDDLRINDEAIHDIEIKIEDTINCEEALRHRQTLVCGVIERPLKPLRRGNEHRIHEIRHHEIRKRCDTL